MQRHFSLRLFIRHCREHQGSMLTKGSHLVVDGYNIINQWDCFSALAHKSLEVRRDRLVDVLKDVARLSGMRITIVFDGNGSKEPKENRIVADKVEVVFASEELSADGMIVRISKGKKPAETLVVATSDGAVQQLTLGFGAVRISARELECEINKIYRDAQKHFLSSKRVLSHKLSDRIPSSVYDVLHRQVSRPPKLAGGSARAENSNGSHIAE